MSYVEGQLVRCSNSVAAGSVTSYSVTVLAASLWVRPAEVNGIAARLSELWVGTACGLRHTATNGPRSDNEPNGPQQRIALARHRQQQYSYFTVLWVH